MTAYIIHEGDYDQRNIVSVYLSDADLSIAAFQETLGVPKWPGWDTALPVMEAHQKLKDWGIARDATYACLDIKDPNVAHAAWIATHPDARKVEWEEIG